MFNERNTIVKRSKAIYMWLSLLPSCFIFFRSPSYCTEFSVLLDPLSFRLNTIHVHAQCLPACPFFFMWLSHCGCLIMAAWTFLHSLERFILPTASFTRQVGLNFTSYLVHVHKHLFISMIHWITQKNNRKMSARDEHVTLGLLASSSSSSRSSPLGLRLVIIIITVLKNRILRMRKNEMKLSYHVSWRPYNVLMDRSPSTCFILAPFNTANNECPPLTHVNRFQCYVLVLEKEWLASQVEPENGQHKKWGKKMHHRQSEMKRNEHLASKLHVRAGRKKKNISLYKVKQTHEFLMHLCYFLANCVYSALPCLANVNQLWGWRIYFHLQNVLLLDRVISLDLFDSPVHHRMDKRGTFVPVVKFFSTQLAHRSLPVALLHLYPIRSMLTPHTDGKC